MHEKLALVDLAPCGARGIVASLSLSLDELQRGPLVIVPKVQTALARPSILLPTKSPLRTPTVSLSSVAAL